MGPFGEPIGSASSGGVSGGGWAALLSDGLGVLEACEEFRDAVYVKDREGRYLAVNPAGAAALGLTVAEVVGRFDAQLFPQTSDQLRATDHEVMATGSSVTVEEPVVIDGKRKTYLTTKAPLRDADGNVIGIVGVSTDITDRKAAEDESERRRALRGDLVEVVEKLAGIGNFEWEVKTDRVTWSDGLYRIFGAEPGEFPGTLQAYLDLVHPEDRPARRADIEAALRTGEPTGGEARIVRGEGEIRWIDSRVLPLKDEAGAVERIVGTCQDVTSRKQAERELERRIAAAMAQALRDPLTGLANRTLALDRLGHALKVARRRGHDLAVLFIDVDGFKSINDRYGHATGDRVLSAIADRFRATVRGSDTVARIGGDEFLVICEEGGAADGVHTASRLVEAFGRPFEIVGTKHAIPLSIGISIAPPKAASAEQMIAEADAAMYEAKHAGGSGFRVFDSPGRG